MTLYAGFIISVIGLWAHHPIITLAGIGVMSFWLIQEHTKESENA